MNRSSSSMSKMASKSGVIPWEVKPEPRPLEFNAISAQLNFLKGEVLTIVDASYSETIQRKAVKDLIHSVFSAKVSWFYELCGYPNRGETKEFSSSSDQE